MTLRSDARCILLREGKLFCETDAPWQPLSGQQVLAAGWTLQAIVPLHPGDASFVVVDVTGDGLPGRWIGLRDLMLHAPEADFRLAGLAAQMLEWNRNHRYCGRCGSPTQPLLSERALTCGNCGLANYPRLSPCVIVLITRGDEILLARSHRYTLPIYSCLAGFVEAGESAEEAVHREVLEEAGVRVRNLRYQYSQPWPFPHQLMLGYFAEYAEGELAIDTRELADARWFDISNLPQTPPPQTIAGQLIAAYLEERRLSR